MCMDVFVHFNDVREEWLRGGDASFINGKES
jgi:hypothetical protein